MQEASNIIFFQERRFDMANNSAQEASHIILVLCVSLEQS